MDGISSVRHPLFSGKGHQTITVEDNDMQKSIERKELSEISSSKEQSGPKTSSAASLQVRDKKQIIKTQLRLPNSRLDNPSNRASDYTLTTKR